MWEDEGRATFLGQGLMLIELLEQATKKTRISASDKWNHWGADCSKAEERESQGESKYNALSSLGHSLDVWMKAGPDQSCEWQWVTNKPGKSSRPFKKLDNMQDFNSYNRYPSCSEHYLNTWFSTYPTV